MGAKAGRSVVNFLPDGAGAYPAYNTALRRPDKAKPPSGNPPSGNPHRTHTVNDSTFSNAARRVSGVNVTGSA